jgi:hypothetical protein
MEYPLRDVAHIHGLSEMLYGCEICEERKN